MPQLIHNVYFWVTQATTNEEHEEFLKGLKNLSTIPSIKHVTIGTANKDVRKRPVTENDYDYSLLMTFDSLDDYLDYDKHENHLKFTEKFKNLWHKVKVYDAKNLFPDY